MIDVTSNLPEALKRGIADQNIIVFDGECVLCSAFFRFVVRHDPKQTFQFATAQSPVGQELYAALELPADVFETNLVIVGGSIHGHLDAFAVAMAQFGWPWRLLTVLRYLPDVFKLPLYRLIARNRFRMFGRFDQCMIPNPQLRSRFVENGF